MTYFSIHLIYRNEKDDPVPFIFKKIKDAIRMNATHSLPNYDYDKNGKGYGNIRQTDPRIAQHVFSALEDMDTVLNVGAGAGSYEPETPFLVALEPSSTMRNERSTAGKSPAVIGSAENLPFDDGSFDAIMAMVTVHHWQNLKKGLTELKRVAAKKVVILTFDPNKLDRFWNIKYFPDVVEAERKRYPAVESIIEQLGGKAATTEVPIPIDCLDGFQEAFYGRPEMLLQQEIRHAQSAWGYVDKKTENAYVKQLKDDLDSGEWDKKYGYHRELDEFTGALTLITVDFEK